ncbi:MAG: hypothetical protein N3C12_15860 [Candidatus Binatia bacterium]|nr:hypothetical protein [Candidatus Binatia bacterium]
MKDPAISLDELLQRGQRKTEALRLLNVKIPSSMLERIDRLSNMLPATKSEIVVALLNEGLRAAEKELRDWRPPPKPVIPKERRCVVKGCERERVAKGLCPTHYQAQRRALMAGKPSPISENGSH